MKAYAGVTNVGVGRTELGNSVAIVRDIEEKKDATAAADSTGALALLRG